MKNFLLISLSVLSIFAIIYSCSSEMEDTSSPPTVTQPQESEPDPTQYTLTVTAGEGGTVSTEGGTFDEGTEIKITAIPSEGNEFIGWEGVEETSNEITVQINSSINIKALFKVSLFESTSERYSDINETTRYFSLTKSFKRYISLDEARYLRETTDHMFSNFDAVTYDINEDGKLDLFWFGMSKNVWGYMGGSHSNGKYFIISDYFNQSPPYQILEYDSSVEFAAGGVNPQDIDGDGIKEILIFSNNVHQINTYGGGVYITDTSNPPEELGTVILKIDNSFNLISENVIGTPKCIHRGGSGDVDNDGDIDILNFHDGHPTNQTTRQKFPTILYNDGAGNFTEELIFRDTSLEDYYWSMDSTTSHFFDMDGDGFLDIIFGRDIGVSPGEKPFIEDVYWFEIENTTILWGDGSGKFSWDNKLDLILKNELNCQQLVLGLGFTDYDNDGDIDLVVQTTREYSNYILNLFENTGDRSFEDVTLDKIDGYYHFEKEHLSDMGEIMSIDKDGDGDYDLVPKDVKVFCCYASQYDFVSDLYWENTGGQFVRRIND